ncbi:PTS sugar transporter subunit IIA [Vagococcus humatus]|uniref:PTS glucose transporter subunit IIABC n=1 Tax=Vagococcus humatus TaxID=1889241 RepID=A0A3R9YK83_9ENTE|nr:PTS glucose transporter subunit IIA [Vagococcus humatus]RST89640.1 PTS glucose transporter subunit IIABC [Vagococcus humatus]
MFNFFKKNKKTEMFAVMNGTLMPITQVNDSVFSQKMLGDGFAIEPTSSEVFAPVAGKIVSVFPTKHAMTMVTESGLEILVHMGIDTVELKGEPFEVFVKEGDKIAKGTKLATMDLAKLAETQTPATTMVVITNMDLVKEMPAVTEKAVSASEAILEITIEK